MKEKYAKRLIELTQSLVDIPTVNMPPNGDEKAGQEFIEKEIAKLGLSVERISPCDAPDFENNDAFIKGQNYEDRYNVFGRWKGSGGGRSVILNGHMDVVTDEPGPWTVCPAFKSIVKDGRVYGRGTADMKGGLACALTAVEMLKDEGFEPKGDICFESVVDEEYASSAGSIAARQLGYNSDFAILFEPTGFSICPACVGSIVLKVTVEGSAGMPYTGEEVVNPVYMLGEVISLIKEYEQKRLSETVTPKLWEDTPQAVQLVITKAKSGDIRPNGQLTTPPDAWIELVIQTYPYEDMQEVYDGFEKFLKERFSAPDKIKVELEFHFCRASDAHPDDSGLKMLKKNADKYTDKAKVCGAMFSCDMFAFSLYADMPCCVFGPEGGRLHGPDEWVSLDSMEKVTLAIHDFLVEWCG